MKCLMEGKQFTVCAFNAHMHFIQNANYNLGEEVVPMPAKKKKAARKTAKRKPARRKAAKKTAKRKTARKSTSRRKKRK